MKKLYFTEEERREKKRFWHRKSYEKHRDEWKIQRRLSNPNLTEEQRKTRRDKKKIYDENYKAKARNSANKSRKQNRLKVLNYYSQEKLVCARCGFSDIRALTIDHIYGGGCDHVKQINTPLVGWIIRNNFPEGFQILCMNCQKIKQIENNELQYRRKRGLSY